MKKLSVLEIVWKSGYDLKVTERVSRNNKHTHVVISSDFFQIKAPTRWHCVTLQVQAFVQS